MFPSGVIPGLFVVHAEFTPLAFIKFYTIPLFHPHEIFFVFVVFYVALARLVLVLPESLSRGPGDLSAARAKARLVISSQRILSK